MKREILSLIGMSFLLLVGPAAVAQDGGPQPCPDVSPGALGCELIAWSRLQEPAPLPEPDANPAPTANHEGSSSPDPQTQPETATRSIVGIIVREGEKYVLKAGDNTTYELDDQERARRYQDKQVKVVGKLDSRSNSLHIESIELVS
jgi:Protein of unknown function (DUF5818)